MVFLVATMVLDVWIAWRFGVMINVATRNNDSFGVRVTFTGWVATAFVFALKAAAVIQYLNQGV